MNKFRKIMAVCACSVLTVATLSGCSNKTDDATSKGATLEDQLDFYSSIKEAAKINNFEYDIEIDAATTSKDQEAKIGLNLDGKVINGNDAKNVMMTMNIGFNVSAPNQIEFKDVVLTDIIVANNVYYINTTKLIDSLTKIAQTSQPDKPVSEADIKNALQSIGITTDYVKLDMSEINQISPETTNNIDIDKMISEGQKFSDNLKLRLEKAFASVKPQLIGKSNGEYTFAITNANLDAICDAIASFCNNDMLAMYDELIEAAKAVNAPADIIEQLTTAKPTEESIQEVVKQINSIKENADSMPKFAIDGKTSLSGSESKADRIFNGKFKAIVESIEKTADTNTPTSTSTSIAYPENTTINFNCAITMKEIDASTKITIPEGEIVSLIDIIKNMNTGMPSIPEIDVQASNTDYSGMFSDGTF